jgi:hypothetical protein
MKNPTALLATFATTLAALSFAAAPALAAPETPESEKASAVTATTATIEGILNPHATKGVEGGEYVFLYNYSPTECENVFETGGMAAGLPKEAVSAKLTELQPSLKYTFCLEEKTAGGVAKGVPVTFETEAAPPTIVYLPPEVKASEATLPATINPNNQEATYFFEYAESEAAIGTASAKKFPGERTLSGYNEEYVSISTGPVLTQNTTYYYRVVAKNTKGEENIGKVEHFTTGTPEGPGSVKAESVRSTTATLAGVLNPNHAGVKGSYEFVYEHSPTECDQEHVLSRAPEPAGEALGAKGEAKSVGLTDLLPGATYTFCLVAHSETGGEAVGSPVTFTTESVAPTVGEESFSNAGSSSVALHGQVDPGGAPTSYYFQYATESEYEATKAYGAATPLQSAGAGSEPVSVLANLEGLAPGTTYHFRVIAENEFSTRAGSRTLGPDATFNTFPAEEGLDEDGLPDGRSFELVSPLDNGDATVLTTKAEAISPVRAAADGAALTYVGTAPPVGGKGRQEPGIGFRSTGNNVYLAKRGAAGGWTAADIQPVALNTAVYQGFSSDLSVGVLGSEQELTEGAPNGEGHQGLYSRDDASGAYDLLGAGASYAGSTPDGSYLLFGTSTELEDFESATGHSYPVNILPNGTPAPEAMFGSPIGANRYEESGFFTGYLERVISDDGSRIFWTDVATGNLYVRENDSMPDASTVLIAEGGQFRTASSNGEKVFFTDEKQLTVNSTAAAGAPNLYEYDLINGTITDLSVGPNFGEHADVVGVLGASETGSYVYFAAAGATPSEACLPLNGPEPPEIMIGRGEITKCNIYVVHEREAPRLVAPVSVVDGEGGNSDAAVVRAYGETGSFFGDWVPNLSYRSAHVASDGRQLVFESFENLTGFNAKGGREIYMYDFETGGTSCVSCNPSGTSTVNGGFADVAHAELPPSLNPTYTLRDISADGERVFFTSNEALVSRTTNEEAPVPNLHEETGLANVYEWEREGADASCPAKARASSNGGCIFLLSDGTSSDIAIFLDASESGEDVFFATRAELVPQDHGEVYEVYDARVGATQPPAEPQCSGAGCQGVPAAPPIFATPSSVTFNGIGNFSPSYIAPKPKPKACKKGFSRKKGSSTCTRVKPKPRKKAKRRK